MLMVQWDLPPYRHSETGSKSSLASCNDRATLRKFWNKQEVSYSKGAPFHILITSYQFAIQINNASNVSSGFLARLKISRTCLARAGDFAGSHCRDRLLLTGTPIPGYFGFCLGGRGALTDVSHTEFWSILDFRSCDSGYHTR